MDEDYDRIEREIAEQNERIAKLIATAESVLERSAAATDKLQDMGAEIERELVELRRWKPGDWQLEGAITAALKNVRDREAVQRVVGLLKASPQATRETLAKNLIRVMGRGTKRT